GRSPMSLPFTVTVVPPGRADFKRLARSQAAWLVVVAMVLAVAAITLFVRHSALATEPSAPTGSIHLVGVPAGVSVAVDGQTLPDHRPVLTVPVGEHTVAFHGERVVDTSDRVVVRADWTTTLVPDLWLRQPVIRELRPTYPGSRIVGASFLSDGRV